MQKEGLIICSFCSKNKQDTNILIAGNSAHICDLCIQKANKIVEEDTYSIVKDKVKVILKMIDKSIIEIYSIAINLFLFSIPLAYFKRYFKVTVKAAKTKEYKSIFKISISDLHIKSTFSMYPIVRSESSMKNILDGLKNNILSKEETKLLENLLSLILFLKSSTTALLF